MIQRVLSASVTVDGQHIAGINRGALIFIGFSRNDSQEKLKTARDKVVNLRIFPDQQGRTSLSVDDVSGELLIVPQFTLLADCSRGRRPDFTGAAAPDVARDLFETFCGLFGEVGRYKFGAFQADMKINLINDGPFTLILDL